MHSNPTKLSGNEFEMLPHQTESALLAKVIRDSLDLLPDLQD